jgi:hypothetical protein
VSRPAVAQSSASSNWNFPNFTGIKIGIVVGAVVVGGLVVYLVIPKQKTIVGCVESVNGVSTLNDEKDHRTYALLTDDVALQSGQRLKVKGKKSKDKSGAWRLRMKKLVKDEGACGDNSKSDRKKDK